MSSTGKNRHRYQNRDQKRFVAADNQNPDRTLQFLATERLKEADVGITEYVSLTLPGFSGIIKARYSDFHVNEINTSNEIAKLTDLTAPKDFYNNRKEDEDDEEFKSLVSKDIIKQLHDMLASEEEDLKVEMDVEKVPKEQRSVIYDGIRAIFGSKMVANTIVVDGKKVISFKKHKKGSEKTDNRRKWPSDKGQYVHFLVYKEVLDTLEACFKIADCLRINPSGLTYAGVKDRRAKTTQWFCGYKLDPKSLLAKTKPITKLHIGNITFHTEPLKLGQLNGNHFKVALRNITAENDILSNSIDSLKNNGFINYYGLQRFGNDKEVPTYEIGINLLLGKFKEACNLILKIKTSESPTSEILQAKRIYNETKDCQLASKQFRRLSNKCVESKLLLGFVKNSPNDYVNSLENIPRNMRLLYIHSFQSLVWNTVASLRVKKYGLVPIEGDIVMLNENCDEEDHDFENIKILTKDDVAQYTIYDVVLPLPGYDIKYPENDLKESYKEILGKYGLTLEMPKQSVKTYTLSGAYRKVICKATNVSWKVIRYDHPDDNLIRSDYEELMGVDAPQDNPIAQYKGLVVEFSLPPSGYATMALRELLKMDTSCTAHAKLNKYHTPASNNATDEPEATSNSLLSNAEKYEAFKRQVFGVEESSEEQSKRKLADLEESPTKKSKTSEKQTEENSNM